MANTAAQTHPLPVASPGSRPPITIPVSQPLATLHTGDLFSPVTQNGSFEFDRIIKSGEVLKRTRKTKAWKLVFIVLRPNLLSIYKDKDEDNLRHQINLSDLTAVARQKDPKRRGKPIFGLFTPSRNYHLEARSDKDAQEWVELIRQEARIDANNEEFYMTSPTTKETPLSNALERSVSTQTGTNHDERGGYSSSDMEAINPTHPLPRQRERGISSLSGARRTSHIEYSGADHGSYSDFSDSAVGPTARMSALSLSSTGAGRPSTSSGQPALQHSIYGQTPSARPGLGARNASQMSGLGNVPEEEHQPPQDDERVVYHGWNFLLKSSRGVRQWKKVWMVLRPKALALYPNEEEYTPKLILPFSTIIDVVEIDPISRTKTACMQVISEERNFRFCALDEESLARWLGAFKSLLSKRKAKQAERAPDTAVVTVHPHAPGTGQGLPPE